MGKAGVDKSYPANKIFCFSLKCNEFYLLFLLRSRNVMPVDTNDVFTEQIRNVSHHKTLAAGEAKTERNLTGAENGTDREHFQIES